MVDDGQRTGAPDKVMTAALGLVCCVVIALLTLAEGFAELPGAAAAFGAAWVIVRSPDHVEQPR